MIDNPVLIGGDLIFWSSYGDILDDGIRDVTGSVLTHTSMVVDPTLKWNGQIPKELMVLESTILKGQDGREQNGPQVNSLGWRMSLMPPPKTTVMAATLSARYRVMIDWNALWTCAVDKIATNDTYNILELGEDLIRAVPVLDWIPFPPDQHAEVCSEFMMELLRAGGVAGLHPFCSNPQKLFELAIWDKLYLLQGPPVAVRNFNTL